ncbi:A24 family peptidase [Mycolicibacterium sp.]|uniref:A24 family peptidase n=1 Tax=Mycolicibacterium sp. TaxID=2320850 RepID=UPI003D147BB0
MAQAGVAVIVAAVAAWLIALCAFDVRHRRLPNVLTVPGAAVILAGATIAGHGGAAALGALAWCGCYAMVHLAAPAALGAGDVKLAAGLGGLTAAVGPQVWLLAVVAASLLSAGLAAVAALRRAGPTVPHGPSMCLASAAAAVLALV